MLYFSGLWNSDHFKVLCQRSFSACQIYSKCRLYINKRKILESFYCDFRKLLAQLFPTLVRKLKNNAFNGTLNLGDSISAQLVLVDLQNNQISQITIGYEYNNSLLYVRYTVHGSSLYIFYVFLPGHPS